MTSRLLFQDPAGFVTPLLVVFAVDIASGKPAWGYDARPNCDGDRGKLISTCLGKYGFSAAPLTIETT